DGVLSGRTFVEMDRALDNALGGPKWLSDPRVAEIVVNAILFGEKHLKYYSLGAYVSVANHVHVVLNPKVPLSRITKSIEGFTATEANKILGRTGEPFWLRNRTITGCAIGTSRRRSYAT